MNTSDRRWYDKRSQVSKAVKLLETFPGNVQSIIAQGVAEVAEQELKADELMKTFRSLGSEKIKALYLSKQKKRHYDQNPVFHKIMNYMHVMSPSNQDFMAERVIELVQYTYTYFKDCRDNESTPTTQHMTEIRDTYVKRGGADVEKFLGQVRETLQQQFEARKQSISDNRHIAPKGTGQESFTEAGGDLKISMD